MEEQIAKARVRVFVGRNLCAREKDGNNNLTEGGVGSQKAQEIGKSRQVCFLGFKWAKAKRCVCLEGWIPALRPPRFSFLATGERNFHGI